VFDLKFCLRLKDGQWTLHVSRKKATTNPILEIGQSVVCFTTFWVVLPLPLFCCSAIATSAEVKGHKHNERVGTKIAKILLPKMFFMAANLCKFRKF